MLDDSSFSSTPTRENALRSSKTDFANACHFGSNNELVNNKYNQGNVEPVLWTSDLGHDMHSESIANSDDERKDDEEKHRGG